MAERWHLPADVPKAVQQHRTPKRKRLCAFVSRRALRGESKIENRESKILSRNRRPQHPRAGDEGAQFAIGRGRR
jgi:hypothetical protein